MNEGLEPSAVIALLTIVALGGFFVGLVIGASLGVLL